MGVHLYLLAPTEELYELLCQRGWCMVGAVFGGAKIMVTFFKNFGKFWAIHKVVFWQFFRCIHVMG